MTGEFRSRFPNTRRAAALARKALMDHVGAFGFSTQDLSDIETAAGEALANAAEHGHREGSAFEVHVYVERAQLIIVVQDDGAGFASSQPREKPGHDAPRGFGIYLMRHLMDEVDFTHNGTRVRLAKRMPRSRSNDVTCG